MFVDNTTHKAELDKIRNNCLKTSINEVNNLSALRQEPPSVCTLDYGLLGKDSSFLTLDGALQGRRRCDDQAAAVCNGGK